MNEKISSKKQPIFFVIALVILVVIGLVWNFERKQPDSTLVDIELTTWVDRGLTKEAQENLEKRRSDLENSMAYDETIANDISKMLTLGNLYYSLGDLASAKQWYESILSDYPNDAPAHENLGQTLKEMGDFKGAESHWNQAIVLNPYDLTYIKLADLIEEYFPDRRKEIQILLEEAIASLGQTRSLLIRLGNWYETQGDYERAISHYKVALQMDPENESLRELIKETENKAKNTQGVL
ncbi:hypothetical protein CO172_01720 [Candidatus Uhrbacteria bacterium CG_4_9_14_3_um_filter_36_7]|uniref:Uncharacterized protein n=1 Tax=Candidatus Uhrbacteria bacterium CG_4_9_14_3_um_filter_36_7 TaxID=1975033 RepID=A0A2M7XHN7_9BACT|nr:MAG: hypothetical protein CO172_01720 [Candidatus Uhrbacteria bacterium CG_4_9_14_3_um_filter_36_7]